MRPLVLCLGLLLSVCGVAADSVIAPFVQREELAGAVMLVANKDKVLSVTTVGFADIAAKKPMQADALFWIASQSKCMTAVAVLMLVDEGKIALDDPVEKYLPEFKGQRVAPPKPDPKAEAKGKQKEQASKAVSPPEAEPQPARHPITIREVLSHVSGLPFKSDEEKPTLDGLPLADAVKTYAKAPLATQPGTHYQYSNAGINTAARVLEVVSGLPYETFMQKRLFDPLGMKDTTFWPNAEQVSRLALTYKPDATKKKLERGSLGQLQDDLTDRQHRFPMPAGGLFSTAADTARFCRMLLNRGELDGKRYLSEKSFEALTSRQTPAALPQSYGFGLQITPEGFGHGGAQATNMEVRTQDGLVLVWMIQHQGFPGKGGQAQGEFKKWAAKEYGLK
ncbi:MAG: class A beta-lactamase-related serine hydrolase [Opitutales bacterium]|jgi:CubicO group peptidase (beta-lactamase class C family)|nr:MAG: class A beta-lactamase-related serine hydrolase [Opitutales bacterium]